MAPAHGKAPNLGIWCPLVVVRDAMRFTGENIHLGSRRIWYQKPQMGEAFMASGCILTEHALARLRLAVQ